jgi:cyanophycin synthetase
VRFLKVAFDEQIPWMHVVLNVFQYGHGAHLRWLDSTITDKTSHISAIVAQNKLSLNHLLSIAGFPVTEQASVDNETAAIQKANALGYPVVIKPINLDRGLGVFPHLMSDKQVRHAFQQARKLSAHILIEKHVVGRDYRFMVVNGELIWAIERIPAGVLGDGISTIKTLTERVNQERNVKKNLFQIEIDSDTLEYLESQGLHIDAIPAPGQFIPLKRIANVTAGGTPLPVLDKVHPDNKKLIEDAASVLKLDIAGIDFISPDISQSHFEQVGKIIEINVQPMAHPLLDKKIVSTLVPHQGRIPIIVLCADIDQDKMIPALQTCLEKHYQGIGIAQSHQMLLNGQRIRSGPSLFEKGIALLLRDDVDCLIYCVTHPDEVENEGLPFDRYDCLMLLNTAINDSSAHHVCNAFDTLLKACQGPLIRLPPADEKDLFMIEDDLNPEAMLNRSIIPPKLLCDIVKVLLPNNHY